MMSLESQAIQVEDLGRQVLVQGRKVLVSEMVKKIDLITPQEVRRVASTIFGLQSGAKPTLVCMGQEDVGDYHKTFRTYGLAV